MKPIPRAALTLALPWSALLGGCAAGPEAPNTISTPADSAQAARPALAEASRGRPIYFRRVAAPDIAKAGIYVAAYYDTSLLGLKSNYKEGRGPVCTIYTGPASINDIAADRKGNLIVPQGSPYSVAVYAGPDMCGSKLGQIPDPYGQASAAASLNAATGTIVVADLRTQSEKVGNIARCTLASGCTSELTNPNVTGYAGGVALAKNGDCWLVSENAEFTSAAMTYWPGCTGSGEAVSGFKNTYYGSLSIDKHGNILSIDFAGSETGRLWVYSGCNPVCTVVGGPFALNNQPFDGALNAKGDTYGVMEQSFPYGGEVDIYKYSPTKLTYEYSFDSGFAAASQPDGFAYSPAVNE